MFIKRRAVKWTVVFFVVVLLCTFFSKTIYYFTLPKVSTSKPAKGTFTETASLSQGALKIKDAVSVKLDLPAAVSIDEVLVTEGEAVSAGDEILRFSTDDIKKQLAELDKQRESAEIALSEFVRGFNVRLETLRQQIPDGLNGDEATIKSKDRGIVTALNVRKGDNVVPGMKLCEIADNSRLLVHMPFSVVYDIKPGMKADVSVPAFMTTISGTVTEIGGPITLFGAKARSVTIELENPGTIAAGEAASAVIEGGITPMADGKLEYLSTASIYAEAAGTVASLGVSLYENVPAGKALMKIELANTNSAKSEYDYMLSTGIYNGRTEKQLRDALAQVLAAIERLSAIADTGSITAEGDGIISELPVQKYMRFSGGTIYEYAPENSKYEVVFTSSDMSAVKEGQSCLMLYYIDGRQATAKGKVTDVGLGYVKAESVLIGGNAIQAQSFYAEVTLSSIAAEMTVPASAMASSTGLYVVASKSTVLGEQYIASLREVTVGQDDAQNVEIISGITPEDIVIVAWDRALSDGAVVDIAKGMKP